MMFKVAIIALVLALSAVALQSVRLSWAQGDLGATTEALEAAQRELAAMELVAEQRATTRDVARAEAERLREAAAEADEIREFILRSDDDAPIPDLLRDVLDRLLARGAR